MNVAIAANAQTLDCPPIVSVPPLLPPPPISWIALINTDNIMEGNNGNPVRMLLAQQVFILQVRSIPMSRPWVDGFERIGGICIQDT